MTRPDPFHAQIAKALANPSLQAALDQNAEKRKHAYTEAFARLPDAAERRERARRIRLGVVAHLPAYLEQFIHKVEANGIHIHRAADGAEAVAIVLEIARQHQVRKVAKSKTMVSEEIDLNEALQAAGLEVVETDLGEYIVQLRGERPGHILTPAVHLRRAEVGQTFAEKLGVPYTEDVEQLTQVARERLRDVFLKADMGVSGVNFGVVETGTLCVLTNEGNGRMVTTLPPVHVALMGIERLVPTLADLADLVAVLPRASSGQSMTVYASLIHGPRRPDDPDGPQERHLVLVDNGRSRLQSGPLAEALACIRCGACLNACPVFREIGGHAYVGAQGQASVYSGPIGSVIASGLFGTPIYGSLARASSLCGACREACPVGIDLPELLLRVRAGQAETSPASPGRVPEALAWGLRLFAWAAASAGRFRLAQKLAGFAGSVLGGGSGWLRLPAFTGWGYVKDFPQPAWYTFQERFQKRPQPVLKEPGDLSPLEEYPLVQAAQTVQDGEAIPSLIDRFEQEIVALGGEFFRCREGELPALLLRKIEAEGGQQVWAWDENNLPAGLLAELGKLGVKITHQADPAIKVGLTGALAAAAETGTLALPGGAGRPLQASLLPEIHLAVLQASRIHWSLADLLALPEMTRSSAAALVSGPSRTGDIELTLTVGVHGPGKVVVFCVEV